MKNSFGTHVTVTLFGESHGAAIGAVIDGLAPGIAVDSRFIADQLTKRRPKDALSTQRREGDPFQICSGVFEGKTTGTPICILIPNENVKSSDYGQMRAIARPGHADYAAYCKYHGYEDYRGGGHFSGRITAALVAAGAIAISALRKKGIVIGTHIVQCGSQKDRPFDCLETDIATLCEKDFAVLDDAIAQKMQAEVLAAKDAGDSIGGILETAVIGVPAGLGEPWFDSVEGVLSHILFSVPAVKGVEFGLGFGFADCKGSQANDPFRMQDEKIVTTTNHNGGINGGITNGMPITFRCAVKPTPSIYQSQETVNFIEGKNTDLTIQGRHDPAIIHRMRVVIDSVTALALCDMLTGRFGTDYLA